MRYFLTTFTITIMTIGIASSIIPRASTGCGAAPVATGFTTFRFSATNRPVGRLIY
jgi:hypothetical protein